MRTRFRVALAASLIGLLLAPGGARAELVRFVQVVKNESPDTRFHLSELEVFALGVVPDGLGGGSFGGLSTSTNDIGNGTLVAFGVGNAIPAIGTTSALEHGGANQNPNNLLESGGSVWSTANNQASNSQYTLDLGSTIDVTTVRMWPRADTCCANRWQNLEVNLYADDGTGNPGSLIASNADTGLAPGGNVPLEISFNAGSVVIDALAFTPAFNYPEEGDPAILSSASLGTVVGTLAALNEFGGSIPSATFALVAGAGDTNNASYAMDGNELQVTGDLSGLDGVVHSVLVQGETDEGTFDMAFTFTIILDSDSDGLPDEWELMFGTLAQFMTGGDADGDGQNDEDEFREGTDPSVPDDALFRESFNFDDGGFTQEGTGTSPVASIYSSVSGTWSMPGDGSGTSTSTITSPPITVPVTGGIRVSFNHRFSIEPDWDGAALQVSIDGGPFMTVPTAAFTENGYNFSGLLGNHVLQGGDGFNGDSLNFADGEFITSVAGVGGVRAGGTIAIRFLGAWDSNTIGAGSPNWQIDSITVDFLPDQDMDGMPDSYEDAVGLDKTVNDAGGDADMDNVSNLDEYLNRTDPNDNDTDNDGLTDDVETNTGTFADAGDTGTDPLNPDTDGDGLLDSVEDNGGIFVSAQKTGTDPNNPDSDGDAVPDGTEVNLGSNPNDPNSVPPVALLAYFDFNGTLVDQAANSPDLVLGGAAALTTGGQGVSGGGSDESLDLKAVNDGSFARTPAGNHLDLASINNSISVAFWQFNTQIASTSSFWLTAPLSDGTQRGFQAHVPWSNGTVYFDQSGCCDPPERMTVVPVINLNAWQHFVFQRNSNGDREIWIDGVLAASAGAADPLDPFDGVINIGAQFPAANSFAGRIDDFAIFSDSLTPEQIEQLAAGGSPLELFGPTAPFAISAISHDSGTGLTTVEWNSRPNKTYAIDASNDLQEQNWVELNDSIESQGDKTTYSETLDEGVTRQYYRVRELQ